MFIYGATDDLYQKNTCFFKIELFSMRCIRLSTGMVIIIDEVSMVGSNMLEIHKRLQQVKGVSPDVRVSILAVGDLPPVGQPWLFTTINDSYTQLYRSGSLWVDEFEMIELNEIVR